MALAMAPFGAAVGWETGKWGVVVGCGLVAGVGAWGVGGRRGAEREVPASRGANLCFVRCAVRRVGDVSR